MPELNSWTNFYVIVGSAAGTLIGLQFVVMTLISSLPLSKGNAEASDAFSSPTVSHFSVVLLLSVCTSIPWPGFLGLALLWGIIGLFGIYYITLVTRRLRRQQAYRPIFEDWLFHAVLPILAYKLLIAAAFIAAHNLTIALFTVATSVLILLFTGVHIAWDNIRHIVFLKMNHQNSLPFDNE